MTPENLQL